MIATWTVAQSADRGNIISVSVASGRPGGGPYKQNRPTYVSLVGGSVLDAPQHSCHAILHKNAQRCHFPPSFQISYQTGVGSLSLLNRSLTSVRPGSG